MGYRRIARHMWVGLLAMLLVTGGLVAAARADKTTSGLAADQMIACLQAAVAAQPGLVKDVEVEDEEGQWNPGQAGSY